MSGVTLRRAVLLAGVLLCASAAVAVPAGAGVHPAARTTGTTVRESFERDFGGWQPDTDGRARRWNISRSTAQAVDGWFSLAFDLDGTNDDGTIWIERTFTAGASRTATVQVSFWLWSPAKSFTAWPVVGVAGVTDPETESDLPIIGFADRSAGWSRYSFTTQVQTGPTGTVWVAVGISATWETVITHYIDLVETTIG
jgi:hypothetical protein